MDTVGLYKPIEKVVFLVDAAGGFSEQEIRLVQAACPELSSVSPRDPVWRRSARPWRQDSGRKMRRAHTRVPGWQEILTNLYSYLGRPANTVDFIPIYGPCGGDGYGNTYTLPPGPAMVDYLVSAIPRLDAQAREIYKEEGLERPRVLADPEPRPAPPPSEVPVIAEIGLASGYDFGGPHDEVIRCILEYAERWMPDRYGKLLNEVGASYGNVANAMIRTDLSFAHIRAILVAYARFSTRQCGNQAYITSGRLQRMLARLGELRQAEGCPLLRPRKGGMEDGNG